LTRKGKGTKWMLVTDGNGTPIGFLLAGANEAEVRLAEPTLATVRVPKPPGRPGRPRTRPGQVVADRGYDSRRLRRALGRRGIRTCIPAIRRAAPFRSKGRPPTARREDYARRWLVERTFAWLGNFRRLLVRWERHLSVYRGFFTLALALLCLRRLSE
jgi:transposase